MGTTAGQSDDAGAAGAGTGGAGGGATGDAGAAAANAGGTGSAAGLDRSKLSPVLAGMDEDQLNEVFDTMFTALKTKREEPDYSGVPAHARPREEPKPAEPTQDQLKEAYRKMLDPQSDDFNPMAAFQDIMKRTTGPLMGSINQRAIAGMMSSFRDNVEYPDFKEHERDIAQVLAKKDPTTLSESDVIGTYLMVVGAKQIDEKRKAAKKPPTTVAPSPDVIKPPVKTAVSQLDEMELSVARAMYRGKAKTDEEAATMYLKDADLEGASVKVPIGGGKSV